MSRLFRRAWEIARSEAGGCAPMPPELATGVLGCVFVLGFVLLLGGFLSWCAS